MVELNNLAIIQARMGSSRLPGKVLKELAGKPVLWHVIHRVKRSQMIDEVVVATSFREEDLEIVKYCADRGIRVFVGSDEDVLDRYYQAARLLEPKNVVRITADCPLHDADVIDRIIEKHISEDNDYTSNTMEETFPDGLDCEVMKFSVLEEAWKKAELLSEREHVTQYILKNDQYKKGCVVSSVYLGNERWTLDTAQDYKFISKVFDELYSDNQEFGINDICFLLKQNPDIREINSTTIRNEGLLHSLANDHTILSGGDKNESYTKIIQ